jgi:cell division septation protein DedD
LPKNDEGEFELVLGNRQLISVFLIVVVLLGVFFSMGYIVGRNSTPTPTAPTDTARNDRPATASSTPSDTQPASDSTGDGKATPAAAPPTTAPAATVPVTTQPEPAEPPPDKPAPSKPSPTGKETKPKPEPAPTPERASVTGQPSNGDYWQVVATARPDAEIIAEALTKRGFHAILAPAPTNGVFRVLVGPLEDSPAQAKTRNGLEVAGFKNPILRKY